jgi:D-glycero-D-manno-heptose 1,7-bisphosphate phosphatase
MALVLLDRDGVINEDSPDYIRSTSEWMPLAGSIEAIARLSRAGRRVGVCTNQAGVAKGLFTNAELDSINRMMSSAVERAGGHIDGVFCCTHSPDAGCDCRKPAPGLLLQAMSTFGVEPDETTFVGDSPRDVQAAFAAGCTPILVRTGNGARCEADARSLGVELVFDDLPAAVDWLLHQ